MKKQTKKTATKAAKKALPKKAHVSMRKLRASLEADVAKKVIEPGPGQIVIRNNGDDPKVIDAERLADYFAIHPSSPGAKSFAVTHVPTGYRAGGPYRNRTLARFVATSLRALGGDELWQFTQPAGMTKKKDVLAKIRELVSNPEPLMQAARLAPASPNPYPADEQAVGVPNFTPKPAAIDQSWRSKIDWVAAGKKAHESRMRNLAAKLEAEKQAAVEAALAAAAASKPAKGKKR